MSEPTAHSRFSPSASGRWVLCTSSLAACESLRVNGEREEPSEHIIDGWIAHAALAECLKVGKPPKEYYHGRRMAVRVPDLNDETHVVTREMKESITWAYDYVTKWMEERPGAVLRIEQRVYPGKHWNAEDCHGTADIMAYWEGPKQNELLVLDYKNGAGVPVEVEDNTQLVLYGLGGIWEYPDTDSVMLVIVQPRCRLVPPVQEWPVYAEDLWRTLDTTIMPAINAIANHDTKFVPGEKQCRFCDFRPHCNALAESVFANVTNAFDTFDEDSLDDLEDADLSAAVVQQADRATREQFVERLGRVGLVRIWADAMMAHGQHLLEQGEDLPDWKLVRGKSNRAFVETDEEALVAALRKLGLSRADCYHAKVGSPAQIEAVVKEKHKWRKPKWDKLNAMIHKPEGKLTIAPAADPRDPVVPAGFEVIDEEDPLA